MRRTVSISLVTLAACFGCSGSDGGSGAPEADSAGVDSGASDGVAIDGGGDSSASETGDTFDGASDAPPDAGADTTPSDDVPFATKRAACAFKQGAKPSDTFGPSIAKMKIPIDTIVIVSQENRSFDDYFSQLPAYGQPDVDVPKAGTKLADSTGKLVSLFHATDLCNLDPRHDWTSMHNDYNSGANDGFLKVNSDNVNVLGYLDDKDMPFYYELASTYGIGDRYFSGLLGPTGPNRDYLYAATSSGHIENGHGLAPGQPTIFRRLKDAGVAFKVYSGASGPAPSCPGPYSFETASYCGDIPVGAKTLVDFDADSTAGKLPSVSFIYAGSDEHPAADPQIGMSQVQRVFVSLTKSPQWKNALFILTYDEGGGFYDHVAPPSACPPDAIDPLVPAEGSFVAKFDRYGFRVPLIMASPWSRPHFVSHVVNSHTSILRFLELRFDMPAMSNRDANASPLLEFFDFGAPSFGTAKVPAPFTPADPKTKGC